MEYDESVEQCPDGILIVPAVTTLAPVVWAAGAKITINEIGSTFADSLAKLFSAYKKRYPSTFTKRIKPVYYVDQREYRSSQEQSDASASMLFSGGVDSLACYLNHQGESPALFTIHGTDIGLKETQGWQRIRESSKRFSDAENVILHTIKSNFREVLNYQFLDQNFIEKKNRGWWEAIHHGTGLPALCAPIAFLQGYNIVYEGSGYTVDPKYPTAQPSFVNQLGWGKTEVRITEKNMTRQDKIRYLANNMDAFELPIDIRSCYTDNTGKTVRSVKNVVGQYSDCV